MSITCNCEADVILWAFAKLLILFAERQYTFALHCIWWLASLVQLDTALRYLIEHHQFLSENREIQGDKINREISSTPRDIARDISADSNTRKTIAPEKYITDPLRRTRKGRINSLPQNKKQPGKARQKSILSKKQQNRLRAIDTDTLTEYLSKRK